MTLVDEAAAVAWRGARAFGVRLDRASGMHGGPAQLRERDSGAACRGGGRA